MTLRGLTVGLSLTLVLVVEPTASAGEQTSPQDWAPVHTFGGGHVVEDYSPRIAVGPGGRSAIVWGNQDRVMVSVKDHGGRWRRPVVLGRRTGFEGLSQPDVAVDGRGVITVVWVGGDDYGTRVLARSSSSGRTWTHAVQLNHLRRDAPFDRVFAADVAVNVRGDAVATWGWTRDDRVLKTRTGAAYRPTRGRWSEPVLFDDTVPVALTLDRVGDAMLYLGIGRLGDGLAVARRIRGLGWQRRQRLMPPGSVDTGSTRAMGNSRGDQVIVFAKADLQSGIWARTKPASGRWSRAVRIGPYGYFAVGLDDSGGAACVHNRYGSRSLRIRHGDLRGHWSRARRLVPHLPRLAGWVYANNGVGEEMVAWFARSEGTSGERLWVRRGGHQRWGPPRQLTGAVTHMPMLSNAAMSGSGDALVAWTAGRRGESASWRRLSVLLSR